MALLYGYGTGSTVESFRYDQVVDLLNQIPNNTTNLVKAKDVRDSVFSLWERINDLSIIASASTSTFLNSNPTTVSVGGISLGTTFTTPQTIQQMFDSIFYPYTLPIISLYDNVIREYGTNLSYTFNWSVIKKSNPIQTITINGFSIIPVTGVDQTGTRNVSGTYSYPLPASTTNTFTMQVSDGTATTATTATITWMNKIYWGTIDLTSLTFPNPDLGTFPQYSVDVSNLITSNLIKTLNSQLSITKNKTYTSINGMGNYLIFAWPSSVNGASTPSFYVNGLPNTAFTRVKTGWSFINASGITTNYEVWVTNTTQNSPLNIIIS